MLKKTKRIVLAVFCAILIGVGVSAAPAMAANTINITRSAPGYADTPGYTPCSFGASGTAVGAGKINLRPWFQGCNRNYAKFTCVRLKKYGTSIVKQVCQPSTSNITMYSSLTQAACVNGLNYSLEILFFIGSASYMAESSVTLHCDGTA